MPEQRNESSAATPRDPGVLATQPVIIKRTCPGYLVLGKGGPIRFAVEGLTEAEAMAKFEEARDAWAILHAMAVTEHPAAQGRD